MKTKTRWAERQQQFYCKNSEVSRPYAIIHTQRDIKGHAEKSNLVIQYRCIKVHIFHILWFRVHLTPIGFDAYIRQVLAFKRKLDGAQWKETL